MSTLLELVDKLGVDDMTLLTQRLKDDWPFLLKFVETAKRDRWYFYLRELETGQRPRVRMNGREMLMFTSNNYLGLANDPRVKQRSIEAIMEFGTGCCGSPIVNGHTSLHEKLARQIAAFKRKEEALIFSTGYQTNLGVISALVESGDVVLIDKLNHASIIDGCKLSGAESRAFNHNDMNKLERLLKEFAHRRRRLIVVDGVYSMDGDIANLPEICHLAKKYSAMLMVDEAHATGVMGPNGRGVVEHFGVEDQVDIIMGTMSKSLASVGGFAASNKEVINYLKHYARSFIYSAALPPPAVAAASAAIEIIESEFQILGKRLWENTSQFKNGLNQLGYNTLNTLTPIIPIYLDGDPLNTIRMARRLEDEGLFITPMLPPSVPSQKSRLRAHISAHHSSDDIIEAINIFEKVGKELKVI